MKLFVTDFDRTLYVKRKISVENIEAIKTWQEGGNLFAIATGRDIGSLIERIEDYDLKVDYFIGNNGSAVFDRNLNKIYSRFIEGENLVEVIYYILNNYEGGVSISNEDSKIAIRPILGENNENDYKDLINLEDVQNINKVYQIHKRFKNEKMTNVLAEDLNSRFKGKISAYANSHNVDIVAYGVNKSSAIKFLEDKLGNIDKVITMGDSYNDLGMILDYKGFIISSAKEDMLKKSNNIIDSVADCLKLISNVNRD